MFGRGLVSGIVVGVVTPSLMSGPAHVATSRDALPLSSVRWCRDVQCFSRPWWLVERACLDATTVTPIDCGVSPTCGATVSKTCSVSLWKLNDIGHCLKHIYCVKN
jgi:hypothetical protein